MTVKRSSRPTAPPDRQVHAFAPSSEAFAAADLLIVETIAQRHAAAGRSILVGLSGAQGSGKTTTAARLREILEARGLSTLVLSLDDYYLTLAERTQLGREVHPLLVTRGVPGTHDVDLLRLTINQLLAASPGQDTVLPRFEKARDDRSVIWDRFRGRPQVTILEGWCVGAAAQEADALAVPINRLEALEDPAGTWRAFVNGQLTGPYAELFGTLDLLVALMAPDFDCIYAWRAEQEAALREKAPEGAQIMGPGELTRFIAHYERITRAMLARPAADLQIRLDRGRKPLDATLSHTLA